MMYTIEIYRIDRRCKTGKKLIQKIDLPDGAAEWSLESIAKQWIAKGCEVKVCETFVTRKNLLSGKEYQERYDTPSYCSPSSESYWSM